MNPDALLKAAIGARTIVALDHGISVPVHVVMRLTANTRVQGECWEWTGYRKSPAGHGSTEHRGAALYIHRLSFAVFNGPIAPGVAICHRCDNPICWRPEHLFAGTQADNVADMNAKGRGSPPPVRSGMQNHKATLSDDQVSAIRDSKGKQRDVAVQYGVSQSTVWRIRHNHTRA